MNKKTSRKKSDKLYQVYIAFVRLYYYILSIFHNLGSPLSYHMLIFDLMSSRNMYLYNAYIYTYILLHLFCGMYNVLKRRIHIDKMNPEKHECLND